LRLQNPDITFDRDIERLVGGEKLDNMAFGLSVHEVKTREVPAGRKPVDSLPAML
jgi:hypothetical protein